MWDLVVEDDLRNARAGVGDDVRTNAVPLGDVRRGEEFVRWPDARDRPVEHNSERAAVLCRHIEVVQRRNDGDPASARRTEDVELVADIKVIGRLIEDQYVGLLRECAR